MWDTYKRMLFNCRIFDNACRLSLCTDVQTGDFRQGLGHTLELCYVKPVLYRWMLRKFSPKYDANATASNSFPGAFLSLIARNIFYCSLHISTLYPHFCGQTGSTILVMDGRQVGKTTPQVALPVTGRCIPCLLEKNSKVGSKWCTVF